jgi:hypothetical protein
VNAEGFHEGLAAEVRCGAKQLFEGAVGELNAVIAIEDQDALDHAVEQGFLLGAGLGLQLPPAFLGMEAVRLQFQDGPARLSMPAEPPQMQEDQGEGETGG